MDEAVSRPFRPSGWNLKLLRSCRELQHARAWMDSLLTDRRTSPKWTTTSPGISQMSSRMMIGIPWFYIISVWTISAIKEDLEGESQEDSIDRSVRNADNPNSTNMLPKQIEMDGIVQRIYTGLESQQHLKSTLMVLLGDHGMNDAGNHGGSAPGETSPALVFLSPKLKSLRRTFQSPLETREDFRYYSVVEQSDLAPTLGALLGFPVPKNNLGAFMLDFLPFWPHSTSFHGRICDFRQILTADRK